MHGRRGVARLRCAYFSHAGDVASRYGVSFERLLLHLWQARRFNGQLRLRHVTHLEDLVHAIACIDDHARAWQDMNERYERGLVRRCRAAFDEIDSTIEVRRAVASLRRRSIAADAAPGPDSLHAYAGTRPLRLWLAERLSIPRAAACVVLAAAPSPMAMRQAMWLGR